MQVLTCLQYKYIPFKNIISFIVSLYLCLMDFRPRKRLCKVFLGRDISSLCTSCSQVFTHIASWKQWKWEIGSSTIPLCPVSSYLNESLAGKIHNDSFYAYALLKDFKRLNNSALFPWLNLSTVYLGILWHKVILICRIQT